MKQKRVEELLKKVVSDPNIIPGIHNYCDRWCERCTHTRFCSVYKMEKEMELDENDTDDSNKKFWEDIGLMFKVAAKLLQEKMKEFDINPEELPKDIEPEEDPKDHKTVVLSNAYSKGVADWFKRRRSEVESKFELFKNIDERKATEIADAYEIIQYYFIMISTKTYRCHLPADEDFMDDALGSAKIAVIIIDRSTASWLKVMEFFPEWEDEILGFLKQLAKVKKLILQKLPNAMDFKRPGFDE